MAILAEDIYNIYLSLSTSLIYKIWYGLDKYTRWCKLYDLYNNVKDFYKCWIEYNIYEDLNFMISLDRKSVLYCLNKFIN